MISSDSGIFRLASVGSYLDALSPITDEMSLQDRSNLIHLDKCLHALWRLGENVLMNWCPYDGGLAVLVVPHYALAGYAKAKPSREGASEDFLRSLLSGQRRIEPERMDKVARLLHVEVTRLPLRHSIADNGAQESIVERMIRRYGITYVPCRAVALFDIVGFGLLNPFTQMTQLNSLAYSMNSAQSKLSAKKIGIDFARSTTGDGFYVWNTDLSLDANINLYHFMHLVLADNAIARSKAEPDVVPRLRAGFHAGGSYEFHQAEGLNPTLDHFIVGDVTVEVARMVEQAEPDQVLIGDFEAEMRFLDGNSPRWVTLDSIDFVARAAKTVEQLRGIVLSGERVDTIKCYLTGTRLDSGEFTVRRMQVNDKHGKTRSVFNAKANIYRRNAAPILLGIQDKELAPETRLRERSEHVLRPVQADGV
jgi:class 3 adenylate cyclase